MCYYLFLGVLRPEFRALEGCPEMEPQKWSLGGRCGTADLGIRRDDTQQDMGLTYGTIRLYWQDAAR